ncbi:MAG: RHS repeat domain-containing protein [Planctomycetaceae bacterium]
MAKRLFHWSSVNDCVMHETDGNGNTLVEYTHEPGPYGPLISEHRNGQEYVHHYDAQGSTTMLTDETGNVTDTFTYDALGNEVARTGTTDTPYRWVGRWGYQYDDATDSYYIRERVYEPENGRWTSVDPLFKQERLYYIYARNNSVLRVDPSGLVCLSPCCCCLTKLEFKDIRDLTPGDDISICLGHVGEEGTVTGKTSWGNEFLISANIEKKTAKLDEPCTIEWRERASQNVIADDGTVILEKCGDFVNQVENLPDSDFWKLMRTDYQEIRCPGKGLIFQRDCPITVLKNKSDKRLLCIEVTIKSACDTCELKEKTIYVKQVCDIIGGNPSCKIESGPKAKCTDDEWKKWCPKP